MAEAFKKGANLVGAENYRDSHDIFVEAIRRQPIEAFSAGEWAAIGQIIIHRPCWKTIQQRYTDVAPHVLDVLAEAGFTEWRDHWATLLKESSDA